MKDAHATSVAAMKSRMREMAHDLGLPAVE